VQQPITFSQNVWIAQVATLLCGLAYDMLSNPDVMNNIDINYFQN
jgi:hypothetical protein